MRKAKSIVLRDNETIPAELGMNPFVSYRGVRKGDELNDGKGRVAAYDGLEIYEREGFWNRENGMKVAAFVATTSPLWMRYMIGSINGAIHDGIEHFFHDHLTTYLYGDSNVNGVSLNGHSSGTMDMGDGKIHLEGQTDPAKITGASHISGAQVSGKLTDVSGNAIVTGKVTGTNVEITDYGAQGQVRTQSDISLDLKDVNANIQNAGGKIIMDIPAMDVNGDGQLEGVKFNVDGGQLRYDGTLSGSIEGKITTKTGLDFTDPLMVAAAAGGLAEAGYWLRSYIPGTRAYDMRMKTHEALNRYKGRGGKRANPPAPGKEQLPAAPKGTGPVLETPAPPGPPPAPPEHLPPEPPKQRDAVTELEALAKSQAGATDVVDARAAPPTRVTPEPPEALPEPPAEPPANESTGNKPPESSG